MKPAVAPALALAAILAQPSLAATPLSRFLLRAGPFDDGATLLLVLTAVALALAVVAQLADLASSRILASRGRVAIFLARAMFVGTALAAFLPGCSLIFDYIRGTGVRAMAGARTDEWIWAIVARAVGRVSGGQFVLGESRVGLGRDVVGPWWDSRNLDGGRAAWIVFVVLVLVVSVGGAFVNLFPDKAPVRRGVFIIMILQALLWVAIAIPVAYSRPEWALRTGTPLKGFWEEDKAYSKYWSRVNAPAELRVERFLQNWYVRFRRNGRDATASLAGVKGMRVAFCEEFSALQPGAATPEPQIDDIETSAEDTEKDSEEAATGAGSDDDPAADETAANSTTRATARAIRLSVSRQGSASASEEEEAAEAAQAAAEAQAAAAAAGKLDDDGKKSEEPSETTTNAKDDEEESAKGKGKAEDDEEDTEKEKEDSEKEDEEKEDEEKEDEEKEDEDDEEEDLDTEKKAQEARDKKDNKAEEDAEDARRDLTRVTFSKDPYEVPNANLSLSAVEFQRGNLSTTTRTLLSRVIMTYLIGKPLEGDYYTGLGYLALPAMTLAPALVAQSLHKWYFYPLLLPWIACVVIIAMFGTPAALRGAIMPREPSQVIEFCGELYRINVAGDSRSLRHWRTDQAIIGLTALVILLRAFSWLILDDVRDIETQRSEFGGDKEMSWYESEKSERRFTTGSRFGVALTRLNTINTDENSLGTDYQATEDGLSSKSDGEEVRPERRQSSLKW